MSTRTDRQINRTKYILQKRVKSVQFNIIEMAFKISGEKRDYSVNNVGTTS